MKLALQKQVICPHCWNKYGPEDSLWISEHSAEIGDPVLNADHQPIRFLPSRFTVNGKAIDAQGTTCERLACPRCHLEVPREMFETKTQFWSILGAPSCGKTFFLATLVHRLREVFFKEYAFNFGDTIPAFNERLRSLERLLFENENPGSVVHLDKTMLGGDHYNSVQIKGEDTLYAQPYIFSLLPDRSHPNSAAAAKLSRVLCLYDNAGEHFLPNTNRKTSPAVLHLAQAEVMMFLYDPTQNAKFRRECFRVRSERAKQLSHTGQVPVRRGENSQQIDPQLLTRQGNFNQSVVLRETRRLINADQNVHFQQRHHQPLLVIVTKYDAWSDLLGEPLVPRPWKPGGSGPAGLNVAYIEEVSRRTRDLLIKHDVEIVADAENFAEEVYYIPVSATGTPVKQVAEGSDEMGVVAGEVDPIWVEVPVLFSLCKWSKGMIPTYRGLG